MNYESRLRRLEQKIGLTGDTATLPAETYHAYTAAIARLPEARRARLCELGARRRAELDGDRSDPLTSDEHGELHSMIHEIQSEARSLEHD